MKVTTRSFAFYSLQRDMCEPAWQLAGSVVVLTCGGNKHVVPVMSGFIPRKFIIAKSVLACGYGVGGHVQDTSTVS